MRSAARLRWSVTSANARFKASRFGASVRLNATMRSRTSASTVAIVYLSWHRVSPVHRRRSAELLHPDVPHGYLGGRLDLDAELPRPVVGRRRIVVDHDGHQLPVEDVEEGPAA